MSVRLKALASLITSCNADGVRPFVALEHIESGTGGLLAELELVERMQPDSGSAAAEPGDILFGKLRPYLAKSWLVDRPTFASTELLCIRPHVGINPRWMAYVCASQPFIQWAVATSDGTKMPRTSWEKLSQYRLTCPPLAAQCAIADYLDPETARIDALTTKKQRLIELLNERRMVVMTEGIRGTFTASFTTEATLPWIDRRGGDWLEVKLTLVARLGSGHTPSRNHPEWWVDCTIPWVTTGEVVQMRSDQIEYIWETREKISELGVANSAAKVHPAGTVVLCRTASAGYSAIMGSDMATSQDFATWTCGPLLRPRFLLICLRVMRQDLLGRLAQGSTHQTIYMPDIAAIRVPLPSVGEQDRIVEEVWSRLASIDRAMRELSRQIALLKERRQALITAAVTGELKIPAQEAVA